MSESADEPVDRDPLLAFTLEPDGPKPQESDELLNARVDRLERELTASSNQIELLKAEVATLVAATGDIAARVNSSAERLPERPSERSSKPRSRIASALVGAVAIALGIMVGWSVWSRNSIDAIASTPAPQPVAAEPPPAPEPPPQPIAVPAADTPAREPVREAPARVIPAALPISPASYVGTLSIDAAPGGQVFIDRQPAGQTPLRVQNLRAGSHLVWIERDGYRRFTRVVQVPADRVSRLWADLEPVPAQ